MAAPTEPCVRERFSYISPMQYRFHPWLTLFLVWRLDASSASSLAADRSEPTHTRPNILYCLADDWGWPNAGAYGDKVVRTPNFDRVAREGVLFTHAFSAAPDRKRTRLNSSHVAL